MNVVYVRYTKSIVKALTFGEKKIILKRHVAL